MIKVVFVGDEPSSTNIRKDVAFVGAKCFNTLVEYISTLKPDYYICLNSGPEDLDKILDLYHKGNFKVIALGNKAAERLANLGIGYRKLPHPSGLNRQLNDKKQLTEQLIDVIAYINDYPASGAV